MKEKTQEPDLIDRIANALPSDDVRTAYYREMRHLRSLPENDELLRILRAMMFLTVLTEQVPVRVLTERVKLETACRDAITTANNLEKVGSEYYKQLNQKLTQLPTDIAAGISPEAIVKNINADLKRQFDISTIPIVAKKLYENAGIIQTAAEEYTKATSDLCGSWRSASDEAHEAINKIETAVLKAAEASKKAAINFSNTFNKAYYLSLSVFCALSLVVGIIIGGWISDHLRSRSKAANEIPHTLKLSEEPRVRESLIPKHELIPMPEQEAEPMRLPFGLEPLQDLSIWKLGK